MKQPARSNAVRSGLTIPIVVRIGVTGHRDITDEAAVRGGIRKSLAHIDDLLGSAPHTYAVVSPLAEGADRLVADEVLNWSSPWRLDHLLEAVLPMPTEEYEKDFPATKPQFEAYLKRAERVEALDQNLEKFNQLADDPPLVLAEKKEYRRHAYRRIGVWTADNCDVLFVIWNGEKEKGTGGTAEIFEYAEKIKRSRVWIYSETGAIHREVFDARLRKAFRHHLEYNAEELGNAEFEAELKRRIGNLSQQASKSQIEPGLLDPLYQALLAPFVRAILLATLYQTRYLNAGTAVYILAATSVATVTVVTLFLKDWTLPFNIPPISLEVVQIAAAVFLAFVSSRREWHRKWIDYRFLAERLRAAFFLRIAGISCKAPTPLGHESVSDEWTISAFRSICASCPLPGPMTSPISPLKNFLLDRWIKHQMDFYERRSRRHKLLHERLEFAGYLAFLTTAVAAVLHALNLSQGAFDNALASIAIILPAAGASLAGIRIFREHLRNSRRYKSMVRYLSGIVEKICMENDPTWLQRILLEANEVMMREHQDWRVVMLPKFNL